MRESATMIIDGQLGILFGGVGKDIFNDIQIL